MLGSAPLAAKPCLLTLFSTSTSIGLALCQGCCCSLHPNLHAVALSVPSLAVAPKPFVLNQGLT